MRNQNPVPPFESGDSLRPADLLGWVYTGISGKPGAKGASRRYTKGIWVLELIAHANKSRSTRVLTIRTQAEDERWWAERRAV